MVVVQNDINVSSRSVNCPGDHDLPGEIKRWKSYVFFKGAIENVLPFV